MHACVLCRWVVLASGLLLLVGCVSVDVRLDNFMHPDRGPRTAVLAAGYVVEDLVIHHGDRFIGITHAHHPQSRVLIVFCGGDSFHRSVEGGEALEALAHDADVVLFDYPGYGESTGTPTPAVILETAMAVYDYAAGLEATAGKKRVVYGFSLGGLVAAQVVGSRPVDGLVLEATAQNADSWARSQIPWYWKPMVRLRIERDLASVDAVSALQQFRGRVLLLGSHADRQAPAALTLQLHLRLHQAGVRAERVLFEGAAHGDIPHAAGFDSLLRAFLDQLPAAGPRLTRQVAAAAE